MFTPPEDLADRDVARSLRNLWGIAVVELTYAPVGFGSHHWWVDDGQDRWFATVDDLRMGERLAEDVEAAIGAAVRLHELGFAFVLAPVRGVDGSPTHLLDPDHLLSLYPYVEALATHGLAFQEPEVRMQVVGCLAELHSQTLLSPSVLPEHDLSLPCRTQLAAAMDNLDEPWTVGPYGERVRALLAEHSDGLGAALTYFDRHAAVWAAQSDRHVVTHGEPHRGNTMETPDGLRLIDWETARKAHPERDLWRLVQEDPKVVAQYEAAAGRQIEPELLDLYSLWWDLCDVALYVADFAAPHEDTEDNRVGWQGLVEHLDPSRWSNVL